MIANFIENYQHSVQLVGCKKYTSKQVDHMATFEVGHVQNTGLVHTVIFAALEEGVKQVGQVCHNAL